METELILNGIEYTLLLRGKWQIKTGTKRVISKAGNPRRKTFFEEHFKGRARLININSKNKILFKFTTEKVSKPENVKLEQKILFIDGLTAKNHLVDKKLLIDFLCKKILLLLADQIKRKAGGQIKELIFCFKNVLEVNELVKSGLLTDKKLQIKLML